MSIQEIMDSIKKVLEAPLFKGVFSFVGLVLTKLFGKPDTALQAFIMLLILDLITGFIKAFLSGSARSFISHEKGRKKYLGYAVVLSVCHLLDMAAVPGLRNVALFWGSATETYSILENMEEMGVPMPEFIKQQLNNTKKKYKL
ncbi:hypothetical protein BBF96_03565 [Anoxybacter fermentans]|uniref:Holin n=2 Tax=Anoxybacter fermentans TaxID=1323375 RepID=A0A3S9SW76_9FIRM|nr:hypothetical protein BBF96_03565 [Anoxybacter fermentans]